MRLVATGHRPDKLGGYSTRVEDRLVRFATAQLELHSPEHVLTGMALGWDMALAEAAYMVNIPFYAYIPFGDQASVWSQASQDRRAFLLKHAAMVCATSHGPYAAWKMQRRNEQMVDHGGGDAIVLALWNGSPGGTANCVAYAERRGVAVVNVWRQWERFR